MSEPQDATSLPLEERQDMGLLGTPPVNAAGRPYDPSTGRILPSATPEETPVVTTVTTQTKHSRELYDAASFFGLSEAEADSIETPMLRKMLRSMSAENERARDASERARFWEQQQRQQTPEPQVQNRPTEPEFDLEGELDPEHNPKTHGLLKNIVEENRKLKAALGQIEEREGSRTQQAFHDAWDDFFDGLGDARFGEGAASVLDPKSDEMQLRITFINGAGIDPKKDTPASSIRKLKTTYKRVYGETPKKPAGPAAGYGTPAPAAKPKAPVVTQEEWNRGGVGAPTRRTPEQLPNGREKAIAAVASMLGKQAPQFESDEEIKAGLFRRNGTPQ